MFLALPVAWLLVFNYYPMYGAQIAFRDFLPGRSILSSEWIGLENFLRFFESPLFSRLLINTLFLSVYSLIVGFPIPIILALSLNQLRMGLFKNSVQMISYAPYFISTVVMVGLILQFLDMRRGPINLMLVALGIEPVHFMGIADYFSSIYVWTGVWQNTGFGTIIYLAALSTIDPALHEAAVVDGATRLQRMWHIDIPGILPVIVTLLILNMGQLMNIGFEKIFLLQNPLNLTASEVISTYVPAVHPLFPKEGLTEYAYDPDAGNALLDEAGYDQRDADGFRLDPDGQRFAPRLGTTAGNAMRQQLTQVFKENMAACGIDVQLYYVPSSEWFADGPDGELFGRRYDLGEFAWSTGVQPACELYMGTQIPGPAGETNEVTGGTYTGWGTQNQTGYYNPEYDAACQQALGSLPGTPEYTDAHTQAQIIFSQDVPVIPLFLRLKIAATRPEVKNFGVDPTQNSEFYNLYEIDLER